MACSKLDRVNHTDSLANVYSEISVLQKEHGKELIKQLSLAKNMKVLDLGCGTGYLSALLADCVGPEGEVVAVDPDEARLALARKQYSRPNLVFIHANDATFPEGQYDLVFTNFVLHWVGNKAALLNKVYQNLKPGGQFASVFPEHQPAVFDCMVDLMGQEMAKEMNKDYHWILALEYNHLATAVGFNVTSCNVQNKTLYFTNVETLLKWFCVSTGGRFDPKKVNPATLEEFKWPYGDGPATIEDHHTVTVILSKS